MDNSEEISISFDKNFPGGRGYNWLASAILVLGNQYLFSQFFKDLCSAGCLDFGCIIFRRDSKNSGVCTAYMYLEFPKVIRYSALLKLFAQYAPRLYVGAQKFSAAKRPVKVTSSQVLYYINSLKFQPTSVYSRPYYLGLPRYSRIRLKEKSSSFPFATYGWYDLA